MRLPRWLKVMLAGAGALGPVAGLLGRRAPASTRALRALLWSSGMLYLLTAGLDLAEHFRLEKEATGHWLRWTAIPPAESAVHAAIVATNVSALALARPLRRNPGPVDVWLLSAPVVFLALGWTDELAFHRRRAPHREDVIHATEHLAEGVMWTALYALRLSQPR
jgi:hypothetical protein